MLFALRLLPPDKKWVTRIILIALFFNFAITAVATVSYGLKCRPFQGAFYAVPGTKCEPITLVTVTQQVNGSEWLPNATLLPPESCSTQPAVGRLCQG